MRAGTSSYQTSARYPKQRLYLWTEAVLTLMVCALLAHLARPLSLPGLDGGLAERYGTQAVAESWFQLWISTHDLFFRLDNNQRALLLLRTASSWLPAFGLIGLVLMYGARIGGRSAAGLIILAWSTLALIWRPFGWPALFGATGALAGLLISMQAVRSARSNQLKGNPFLPEELTIWNCLVWPGWVLLTGLGWLWIADFAARGPVAALRPGAKFFGLRQADAIFLGHMIVLLAAANSAPLVRGLARLVAGLSLMWRRPRGPHASLIIACVAVAGLAWLGHRITPPIPVLHLAGGGMPHISSELLRLIAVVAISWAAYRFGEWDASGSRLVRGLIWTTGIGLFCLAGLVMSGDMGPVLILSLALFVFLSVPAVKLITGRISDRAVRHKGILGLVMLGVAGFVVGGVWLWRTALTKWAPQFSHTAALREAARQSPFEADSPNLAQVIWLMDAARDFGGFGLGRVPYCGANAHIGAANCSLASGAPIQLPSDFAFAGLAATWGMIGAAACIAILFAWLRALVLSATPSSPATKAFVLGPPQHEDPLNWLRAWLVAVPCLVAQAQVLVSVGGTLAWTPLTGVTLPLLGYGMAALCVSAVWVGLAVRPISPLAVVDPKRFQPN